MSEGIEKAREVVNKLKGEIEIEKTREAAREEEVKSALATISKNSELLRAYGESAGLGAENLGGESLPLLKVHATGKSLNDVLADGSEPKNGWFYYRKTQEQFESVLCHILTISEGFRADGVEGKKNVFNQIVGGVIISGNGPKPFLMYFTGTKLQKLWDFGKEASRWTKAKPTGIPLFALTVKLTSTKVVEGAKSWFLVNFDISKDIEGNPELVTDMAEFVLLRDNVATVKNMIDRLIATKSTEEKVIPYSDTDSNGNPVVDLPIIDEKEAAAQAGGTDGMPF